MEQGSMCVGWDCDSCTYLEAYSSFRPFVKDWLLVECRTLMVSRSNPTGVFACCPCVYHG